MQLVAAGGLAIIGSRTPPAEAAAFAFQLARGCGEAVIAGLALGIDAAAHRGALAAGMPTVAFVGYGFGATYPPEHRELEAEIVAAGGAIVTDCAPGTPVSDAALIARDRRQAEYARAVVLVISERDGGAMHTVQFAREFGKPIYAVAFDADGNRDALAKGAIPLPTDVDEALRILHADRI